MLTNGAEHESRKHLNHSHIHETITLEFRWLSFYHLVVLSYCSREQSLAKIRKIQSRLTIYILDTAEAHPFPYQLAAILITT
jgi:hypothetical protein